MRVPPGSFCIKVHKPKITLLLAVKGRINAQKHTKPSGKIRTQGTAVWLEQGRRSHRACLRWLSLRHLSHKVSQPTSDLPVRYVRLHFGYAREIRCLWRTRPRYLRLPGACLKWPEYLVR